MGPFRTRRLLVAACFAALGPVACSLLIDTDGLSSGRSDVGNAGSDRGGEGLAPALDAIGPQDADDESSKPGEDGTDAASGCPGAHGPTMVAIDMSPVRFCIDSTEVTQRQYKEFLDSLPAVSAQTPECAGNSTFAPVSLTPAYSDLPITKIDWCDARAFCAWAGKRLCGAIGDGRLLSLTDAVSAQKSEWTFACSRGGSRNHPYGQAYVNGACNDLNAGRGTAVEVGALATCGGGFDGLLDMVGNVSEWENACGPFDGGSRRCFDRGGSFKVNGSCNYASPDDFSGFAGDWGVRCCADLP